MADGLKRVYGASALSRGKGRFIHKQNGKTVRVMAVAEGWVMARYYGSVPFLKREGAFLDEFEIKQDNPARAGSGGE